jgi:mannose-6-phosphate isomerase-like protein (cupin superfamily)
MCVAALTIGSSVWQPDPTMAKRRDLLWLAGLAPVALFGAGKSTIPNATLGEGQAKLTREPFGDLRIYFSGATDQVQSMTAGSLRLKPGKSPHSPHEHSEEELMIVTEGMGEIILEGRVTKVAPGCMMYCAAGRVHGITNTGKSPLLFYFYKWKV